MINWKIISDQISVASHASFSMVNAVPVAGGDSNQAWHVTGALNGDNHQGETHCFIKLNSVEKFDMFAAEAAGLTALSNTHTVKLPQVITQGIAGQHSFIVLEYVDLKSQGIDALLGTQLAKMHQNYAAQYGWTQDNTIGVTPQHNAWSTDWISFWGEQRLGFQLALAARNGYRGALQHMGKRVVDALPVLFEGYTPQPSLLHGDLWAGNHAFLADGTPVVFDPATYFGDREVDIAMTELFGGYTAEFYAAYRQAYPLDAGYKKRKNLYNLYHILNHCNMVSGGYVAQAENMMQTILKNAG